MRKLFCSIICLLSFSIGAFAQVPETFDIATFKVPKGWNKQASQTSLQLSTEDKASGAFCLITLFKSLRGTEDSKANFDAAWDTVVKGTVNVSTAPQMVSPTTDDGWEAQSGVAAFEKDGTKGVAMLVTISGYGKMVNALILTNTQAYEATITAFLETISLKKPEAGRSDAVRDQQQQTADNPGGSQPSLTQHFWKQTQNRRDVGGYAGYSSNTYQFFGNNTYKFSRVDFQNFTPKYYVEEEEGIYKLVGNKITITPRKAVFSSHKINKEDPPIKSGNLGLTMLQYSFELIDLHQNGRLSLLLSPIDGIETKRDGQFSFWLNGEKRKTYSYSAVNANGELVP